MTAGSQAGRGWLRDLGLRAALLFYLAANLAGLLRVAGAVGRPYGGLVWLHDDVQGLMLGFETGPDWPARRAGMVFDDRIVSLDGRAIPLDGRPDVIREIYAATPIGTPVEYEVERRGTPGRLRFRVPVGLFTPWRAAEAYLPFALAALAVWSMALIVHLVAPRDRTATLFALFCLALSGVTGYHGFNGFIDRHHVVLWALLTMYAPVWPLFNALSFHFFARFPVVRPGAARVVPWAYLLWGAVGLAYAASFVPGGPHGPRQALLLTTALGSVANSVWAISSLWRAYRRSTQAQVRQQVLISSLGFGLGIILPFLSMSSYILFRPYPAVWWAPGEIVGQRPVADWLLPLPLQLFAIATVLPGLITVAILRYQVFSAKTALVKALTGTLLLGSVVLAYVAAVYAFQLGFRAVRLDRVIVQAFAGRGDPAWVSHLLATLTTASLFGPLRDRIREVTQELLYPYRVDLATAVRRLMEAVRGDGDGAPASAWRLPAVVARALERILHLSTAQVWFYTAVHGELQRVDRAPAEPSNVKLSREQAARLVRAPAPSDVTPDAGWGPLAERLDGLGARMVLPLVYGEDELVGLVALGPRRDEVPVSPEDRELLAQLTGYLLLLLKNERTIHELQHSRERLATAEETERKRLAAELHDLTLQQLAYLSTVQLELCRRALPEPARADEAVRGAQETARRAAADLRQILSDLSPDVIARRGLVSAVESLIETARLRAAKQGAVIHLKVEGCRDGLLPPGSELALFRCAQEALRNALVHARARTIRVALQCDGRSLGLSVVDDGTGFDVDAAGDALRRGHLGLQAMRDRIEAVGGRLAIESRPAAGAALRVSLPLPGREAAAPDTPAKPPAGPSFSP